MSKRAPELEALRRPREGYIAYVFHPRSEEGQFGEHAYSLRAILYKARQLTGDASRQPRVVVVGQEEGLVFEAFRDPDGSVYERFLLPEGPRGRLSPLASS